MAKGFDCATPLTAALAGKFAADGMEFVCRYLVPSGWKKLTREEAEAISAAGLEIGSVWETTADRALGGYAAGVEDGQKAVEVAEAVGQPKGSCIYFAVDFDATTAQMPTVLEYIRGASEATPDHFTGVYGSYTVIEAARAAGVCSRYWQTYAWSGGRLSSPIHIHQYNNGPTGVGLPMNGIGVDLNASFGNEGFWRFGQAKPGVEEEPEMEQPAFDQHAAQKVIDDLGALYRACADPAVQAAAHYAADELRKATGITIE
ncbi:DUF1906 domain-containing protein [Gorillibacterium sp. sgz5001074]|uniref:DUF1906 domain-containing protein n=1 Tax=Gorillibacterium sp. sgz5001074 TaxID=3446695 RepID=UPI003F679891